MYIYVYNVDVCIYIYIYTYIYICNIIAVGRVCLPRLLRRHENMVGVNHGSTYMVIYRLVKMAIHGHIYIYIWFI